MTISMLSVFIPTFFLVSLTPGLCMTLSLSLGMTVGVRRALWMMAGEMTGVATTAALAGIGVAAVVLRYPTVFTVFKWAGGAYLVYLGVMMWNARGSMAIPESTAHAARPPRRRELISQGFVTAIANPKGWAFDIALLPPFLNFHQPVVPQLAGLVGIILVLEFICLMIYASGGHATRHILGQRKNVRLLNRVAGTLIVGVGVWLALG